MAGGRRPADWPAVARNAHYYLSSPAHTSSAVQINLMIREHFNLIAKKIDPIS